MQLAELMKAEMACGSTLGVEISTTIQQGKMVPKSASTALVRAALAAAPAGSVCLLEGYPSSLASLLAMGEEVGHTPARALLLELSESQAHERFAAAGSDESAATQKLRSFDMHSRSLVTELETRGVLDRIDASVSAEQLLAAASAVVDDLPRMRGSARLVLMLGGPGSGTTEQCGRVAAKFGCVHLCIEKLMRMAVKEESETGRAIADLVRGGKIVPAQLYLALLRTALEQQPGATCLIDGFPKSLDNLQLLEAHVCVAHAHAMHARHHLHTWWPCACAKPCACAHVWSTGGWLREGAAPRRRRRYIGGETAW